MLGNLGELSSEYRTFNLDKINIEDEGMEDLETFNRMYRVDDSKCSLFDEIKRVYNCNTSFYSNNESKSSNYESDSEQYNTSKQSTFIFRIDFYFRRIIEKMTKPKIKELIFELGSLSSNNFLILTKIKSIKSNWPKEKLVTMAVDIILGLINKE